MAMWMVIAVVMMVIFDVGVDGSVKGFGGGGGGAITINITIIKNVEGDSSGDDGDIWSW